MTPLSDGVYRISFPGGQFLSSLDREPGAPTALLPYTDEYGAQEWQVQRTDNGNYTIRNKSSNMYVGFDGDPDMHELVNVYPEPREWRLSAAGSPDNFVIGVPDTDMRLGRSLLRIYPPRLGLAPALGDEYQAWTFESVE